MGIESRAKVNQADYIYQVHTKSKWVSWIFVKINQSFQITNGMVSLNQPSRPDPEERSLT